MLLFLLTRRTFIIQPPKKVEGEGVKRKSTSVCNDYNESLEKKALEEREREREKERPERRQRLQPHLTEPAKLQSRVQTQPNRS